METSGSVVGTVTAAELAAALTVDLERILGLYRSLAEPGGLSLTAAATLASIERLVAKYPPETTVHPGHMGLTTLAVERDTNPFLRELAHNS